MDLEIISTVLAVVRTNNFSAASYIIPCSQSSVSRRVVSAESELNVEIFVRPADSADNSLHLTPAGERIIPIMEKIVENYRELFSVASDGASQHTIRIGFMSNVMPPMSYSMLKADLYKQHPNLDIKMKFDEIDSLLSDLKSRRLDAILLSCVSLDSEVCQLMEQFDLNMLGTVEPSIGISELNPLAGKSEVCFNDLSNETFFMNASSIEHIAGINFFNESRFLKSAREEFGLSSHCQKLSAHMLEVRYQLTRNNNGVFISFIPHAWRSMPGISYLELTDMKGRFLNYCLLSLKNKKNPELELFIKFLINSLKKS